MSENRKTRVMFVCHGNICRSPMAEFIFKDLAKKQGVAYRDIFDGCTALLDAVLKQGKQ